MNRYRPYIALDIETTGLNTRKAQVLQVAAVLDDGVSPIEELDRINYVIKQDEINYGEPYALGMNAWIFQMIKDHKDKKETRIPVVNQWQVFQKFFELTDR